MLVSRPRPPISELVARLKYLEGEVAQLRSTAGSSHSTDPTQSPEESNATKPELLVRKEGKSRYIGDEASIALGEQISELRDIIESSSDEDDSPDAGHTSGILTESGILGGSIDSWFLDSFRLQYTQPSITEALWAVYLENVAPLIAILHRQSMATIIQSTCSGLALTPSDEALLYSVYFAAVVSMKPEVCASVLNVDHDTAVQDCKKAVSQGLQRANLLKCQSLSTLQAAVLSLLCCRVGGDTRLVWAESAVVIRLAQAQGVHRDGTNFRLSPFDIEIRRRLWWHICMLDMLSSRDQGVDTQIRPEMFDTKFPINIDDHDLTPQMTQQPESKTGFTNITICVMNCSIMTEMLWSPHSGDSNESTQDKTTHITALGKRLHEQYLDHFNLDIPIHWVFATIVRLQLSQAWLAAHFQSGQNPQILRHDDRVFQMAVEILQFAYLLQTNEATSQWSWLCKSHKEWHVVAFILSELCVRPLNPETDSAWDVVKNMYDLWQRNHSCSDALLEKPLDRLMERTTASRAGRAHTTPSVDQADTPAMYSLGAGSGEEFDWNEIPEAFADMDWLGDSWF
ncbi:Fungal transcriptional regulatory protein [Penicillium brevicompactum]